MIDTSVTYVSNQTSVNVLRIEATARQERHRDRGQRPEDEQQDDQRAEPADQGLTAGSTGRWCRLFAAFSIGSLPVRCTVAPAGAACLSAARVSFSPVGDVEAGSARPDRSPRRSVWLSFET